MQMPLKDMQIQGIILLPHNFCPFLFLISRPDIIGICCEELFVAPFLPKCLASFPLVTLYPYKETMQTSS